MKYLKLLGLAAMAVIAITAYVGVTAASASVGCKTTTTPCTEVYGVGTEVKLSLKPGTVATLQSVWADVQCNKTTIQGKIENPGSATETAAGSENSITAEECKCAGTRIAHVTWINTGFLELHAITGTDNGTGTGHKGQITVNCTGLGSCIYGAATSGTHLGTLKGGAEPIFEGKATVPWISGDSSMFVCGTTGTWTAEYEVVSPKPVYIEPS